MIDREEKEPPLFEPACLAPIVASEISHVRRIGDAIHINLVGAQIGTDGRLERVLAGRLQIPVEVLATAMANIEAAIRGMATTPTAMPLRVVN